MLDSRETSQQREYEIGDEFFLDRAVTLEQGWPVFPAGTIIRVNINAGDRLFCTVSSFGIDERKTEFTPSFLDQFQKNNRGDGTKKPSSARNEALRKGAEVRKSDGPQVSTKLVRDAFVQVVSPEVFFSPGEMDERLRTKLRSIHRRHIPDILYAITETGGFRTETLRQLLELSILLSTLDEEAFQEKYAKNRSPSVSTIKKFLAGHRTNSETYRGIIIMIRDFFRGFLMEE